MNEQARIKNIFARLSSEIEYLNSMQFQKNLEDLWSGRMEASIKKFLHEDQTIDEERVHNFRRIQVFVSEMPTFQSLFPFNWFYGARRSQWLYGKERLETLKLEGDIEYLIKYPINLIGKPFYFTMEGYRFNERWTRHIRYLHLAATYLGQVLNSGNANVLDIGGSYGIFPGLLKQEFKAIKSGIVEFPEQLLLAYYYLAMNFPEAKINTLREVIEAPVIDNDFIKRYDFYLIPISCYKKIQKGLFNLIVNFNSFGEMSEKWFNFYLEAEVFQGAEYFFTLNRFESRPTYNTDLNILDYMLHEYEKIHFRISPLFSRYYKGRAIFFTEQEYFTSQCFEFIGKRKGR